MTNPTQVHLAGAGEPDRSAEPDTGDHVHHAPTGEDWVVAYVRGDRLCACGWPETLALLSDCTLIYKATPEQRRTLLQDMAKGEGSRAAYARHRLAEVAHG